MRKGTRSKQILRRLTAAVFVFAVLTLALATTEAQYHRQGQRRAGQQDQSSAQQASTEQTRRNRRGRGGEGAGASETTTGTGQRAAGKEAPVTVTRRVSQRTLSTTAIQAIKKNSLLSRSVKVSGNTISPANGYTMWGLSNGGAVVAGGGFPTEAIPGIPKIINGRTVLATYICSCPGSGGNDPCQFGRTATGVIDLGKCENGSCCVRRCVYVDEDGNTREC
jgi:hypothetical protein